MTTLIDTVQPSEAYLEEVLLSARGERSEEAWLSTITATIVDNLRADPRIYAAYGPWWPEVKNVIISTGEEAFGLLNETDVASIYKMSRPALTVLAGVLYMNMRADAGMIFSKEHQLEVNENTDDTEPYDYLSSDPQVDRLIQSRSNFNGTNQTSSESTA
ncbi:TPA: olxA [Enterobacter hormaechei subsp. xiangfangensis]|nr:olxA [Enterobacter hormaechei subsp. xiangfangensis]